MEFLSKKTKIAQFTKEEEFTLHQVKDLLDKKMIKILKTLRSKPYTNPEVIKLLLKKYKKDELEEISEINKIKISKESFRRLLQRYSL